MKIEISILGAPLVNRPNVVVLIDMDTDPESEYVRAVNEIVGECAAKLLAARRGPESGLDLQRGVTSR